MTTVPTLTACPKLDCKAPITHWHDLDGDPCACNFAINGEPCMHADQDDILCCAPRVTAPLHLPDVDAVARAIHEGDFGLRWDAEAGSFKDAYRRNARAVLDLIAAHQPAWVRVEPGTRIEAGRRCRVERANGGASEFSSITWWTADDDSATTYVLHAPPEPEDPRVEVLAEEMEAEWPHCGHEWPCAGAERFRGAARRAINRLDEMGGEGK